MKKWIAHSEDFAKGEIQVDLNAEQALMGEKAVSLLPVGVIDVSGEFEKDDIVRILNKSKEFIGVGKAQYSSKKVRDIMGKKNQKPVIHYDYLYLE